jgi:lysophospholipase L1-like esterase
MSTFATRLSLAAVAALLTSRTTCAAVGAPGQDPMPAFVEGARILFQGDSITDGNRGRSTDPNHILGHGYQFIIAARYGDELAERNLTFINRGISGNRVGDLAQRWQKDTLDLRPDVLSILVGINDLGRGVSAEDYERQYDQLLADTVKALPQVKLVLCEPFGLPVAAKKDVWPAYRKELEARQAIVARLALKYHAADVKCQQAFDDASRRAPADHWIWDAVHPTYAGHQVLADAWIRTVRAYWPAERPRVNTAVVPVPWLERDSYDWDQRHAQVLQVQRTLDPEVVLIGDSITHFWAGPPVAAQQHGAKAWAATFGDHRVLNMGFGWDRTQNVIWRLDHGEMDGTHPAVVVLNIGTNNLTPTIHARENDPAEIADAIQDICARVHAKAPAARIIVMGVFPRGLSPADPFRAKITTLNQILAKRFANQPLTTFLDIAPKLLASDGSISRDILFDGTHPTDAGYGIWGRSLLDAGVFK